MPDQVDRSDDERRLRVERIFNLAAFISHLGLRLDAVGDGWCETSLEPAPQHLQQHGFVHAGVVTTLADHTAGGAARAATGPDTDVITIELKINFLKPARGKLTARGRTIRAGARIVVAESDVFASGTDGRPEIVAKCLSTLMAIPQA